MNMSVEINTLVDFITMLLIFTIVALTIYYLKKKSRLEEWQRRILIVSIFYAVHQLSFYLDELVFQLTNMLFIISLFYAIVQVFAFESRVAKLESERKDFVKRLEKIRKTVELSSEK